MELTIYRDTNKLLFSGNFCPVCHKCYTDDDWDCKMVQCASCDAWVHDKCEEITGRYFVRLSQNKYQEDKSICQYCYLHRKV